MSVVEVPFCEPVNPTDHNQAPLGREISPELELFAPWAAQALAIMRLEAETSRSRE